MLIKPRQLGRHSLEDEELHTDKRKCRKIGGCGIGEKALYLNRYMLDRACYILFADVDRVYKRIAMSKGGFSGKGMFASLAYLVVEYDQGKVLQCNFKSEQLVDEFLACIKKEHPGIPIYSKKGEQILREKEMQRRKKQERHITSDIAPQVELLETAIQFLEKKPELYEELGLSARNKRINECTNPVYRWSALFIMAMAFAAFIFGIYAVFAHVGSAVYFLLFGLAGIFLFSGANVLPTKQNNKRYIEQRFQTAVQEMEAYVASDALFPVPSCYAHPVILKRMIDILVDHRAKDCAEALEVLKQDMKKLNSDVTVEQEEYEEIVVIKPMFLVMNYQ
jgi:hypothetical protein